MKLRFIKSGVVNIAARLFVITAMQIMFVFVGGMNGQANSPMPDVLASMAPPRHMLWAWERPENLVFINQKNTGVAYLAATIKIGRTSNLSASANKRGGNSSDHPTMRGGNLSNIRGGNISTAASRGAHLSEHPGTQPRSSPRQLIVLARHQPLNVPAGTYLMAVIRIESDGSLCRDDTKEINRISSSIESLLKPSVSAVQIDFDARKTEREWYRDLLIQLHGTIPQKMFLSMTSLASWCLGDDWISKSQLPVDEVVPMFFDMGADTHSIQIALDSGNTFGHLFKSIGISDHQSRLNQLIGQSQACILKPALRVYMFSRKPWTRARAERLIQEVDSWR